MKLKWEADHHKNPLARAKGLGSAHHAVGHWMNQRVTALANIPLALWAIWSVPKLVGQPFGIVEDWLSQPLNAVLMILFIISSFYHARLGTQVVVEDYIHNEAFKVVKLIGLTLFFTALAVTGIFSVLKVAL